jgi:hypothetical protein
VFGQSGHTWGPVNLFCFVRMRKCCIHEGRSTGTGPWDGNPGIIYSKEDSELLLCCRFYEQKARHWVPTVEGRARQPNADRKRCSSRNACAPLPWHLKIQFLRASSVFKVHVKSGLNKLLLLCIVYAFYLPFPEFSRHPILTTSPPSPFTQHFDAWTLAFSPTQLKFYSWRSPFPVHEV